MVPMKKPQKIILIGSVLLLTFLVGFVAGDIRKNGSSISFSGKENIPSDVDFNPVWEAWKILEEKFVPATTTELTSNQDHVWGIIEGLASSYDDPYTVFFSPEQSKQFEEEISGSFGGLGIELGIRDSLLTIIAPLKGTPAERVGLQSGDIIIEIDGKTTQRMDIDKAISLLRGEVGTTVTLTIAREGEQEFLTVPIVRDTIEVPTLDKELRDDGIYVLSLYNFGGTAIQEFRTALREFIDSDSTNLIIDLRGNPGGYLQAAVEIASWFLPLGEVVVTEDYGDSADTVVHRSKGYDIMENDWRIVVLIDGGSASASEILAGALREHDIAVLIGENTFGKGSVQELVPVTEDTSLKVTVARWLTPRGISISNTGLAPDLEIAITREDIEKDMDPQLDAAIEYLTTGVLPEPIVEESEVSSEEVDDLEEIE
jgi:carboxyl-terminal processing protease